MARAIFTHIKLVARAGVCACNRTHQKEKTVSLGYLLFYEDIEKDDKYKDKQYRKTKI